jgi:raffinose/stachyose/melibiose transport system substrate-binding protein
MMAEDSNSIAQLESQAGGDASKVADTVGFVPVSATKAVGNTSPNPVGTYYVPKTKNTKTEEAAVGFIKYVTSKSAYQKYVDDSGSIPTLSSATTPTLAGLWADVDKADKKATPGLTLNSSIPGFGNQFGNESDKLAAGQETPQQVATKMQAFVDQALQAEGN